METDSKRRMILEGERLYAEHGIEGASLRQIGVAAGQRFKSAPQYYFGDRDGLVGEILAFRQEALNARRHAMMDELSRSGRSHDVRGLVDALLCPLAELVETDGASYLGFLAALEFYKDRDLVLAPGRPHTGAAIRATDLLREALAELPPADVHSRFAMLEIMIIHGLAQVPRLVSNSPLPSDRRAAHFVEALAGGITAMLVAGVTPRVDEQTALPNDLDLIS